MKLSVIIPVRDEAATVASLLDTLLRQTPAPDEIVVVDGGSTDDTRAIVQQYARNHSHVHLLCDADAFPGRGRNLGAASDQTTSTDQPSSLAINASRKVTSTSRPSVVLAST